MTRTVRRRAGRWNGGAGQGEALRCVAGSDAVALIRREPDPLVARIVTGWASDFEPTRALDLGFVAETRFAVRC
jgi:D-erythronate 2-dehydrogenase